MKQFIPLGSHHVSYPHPKVGLIDSYLHDVYGIIISDYIVVNEHGVESHHTTRTILSGEELCPEYHINIDDRYGTELLFLPTTKTLTLEQLNRCIQQALLNREFQHMFDDLKERGYFVHLDCDVLELTIERRTENHYHLFDDDYCLSFGLDGSWEPSLLSKLYSLQDYLRCNIRLKNNTKHSYKNVSEESLMFMNELLKNQRKHGAWTSNYYGEHPYVNDGVYTYYRDGKKEEMNREEFLLKHPDSFCIND